MHYHIYQSLQSNEPVKNICDLLTPTQFYIIFLQIQRIRLLCKMKSLLVIFIAIQMNGKH